MSRRNLQKNETFPEDLDTTPGDLADEEFGEIERLLKGSCHFPKPRVKKRVLVKALRAQNAFIRSLVQEFGDVKETVRNLLRKDHMQDERIKVLTQQQNQVQKDVNELQGDFEIAEGIQQEMLARIDANRESLAKIQTLSVDLEMLKVRQERIMKSMSNFKQEVTESGPTGWDKSSGTLPASHVMLTNEDRPLTDVIDSIMSKLAASESKQTELESVMAATADQLAEKADAHIANDAHLTSNTNAARMDLIVKNLTNLGLVVDSKKGGESSGLLMLVDRRMQGVKLDVKKLEQQTRGLTEQLGERPDIATVESKIQRKFDDVVDHLQLAVRAAEDDEDEFKRVATDLQDMVKRVEQHKADRRDLLEVKEKLVMDAKLREQVDSLRMFVDLKLSKEEASILLRDKPDHAKVEHLLTDLRGSLETDMHKLGREIAVNVANRGPAGWDSDTNLLLVKSLDQVAQNRPSPQSRSVRGREGVGGGFAMRGPARKPGRPNKQPTRSSPAMQSGRLVPSPAGGDPASSSSAWKVGLPSPVVDGSQSMPTFAHAPDGDVGSRSAETLPSIEKSYDTDGGAGRGTPIGDRMMIGSDGRVYQGQAPTVALAFNPMVVQPLPSHPANQMRAHQAGAVSRSLSRSAYVAVPDGHSGSMGAMWGLSTGSVQQEMPQPQPSKRAVNYSKRMAAANNHRPSSSQQRRRRGNRSTSAANLQAAPSRPLPQIPAVGEPAGGGREAAEGWQVEPDV